MPKANVVPFECPQEQLGLDGIIGLLVQQTIASLFTEIDVEKAFQKAMKEAAKEILVEKMQQKKLEMDYLMTIEEVAQMIGMSKAYLDKARSQGTRGESRPAPKNVEISSRTLYKASTVQRWIKALPEYGGEETPTYSAGRTQRKRKERVMQ